MSAPFGRLMPNDLLELSVDARIAELRAALLRDYDETLTVVQAATLMRTAYGKGYLDALGDSDPLPVDLAVPAERRLRDRAGELVRRIARRRAWS